MQRPIITLARNLEGQLDPGDQVASDGRWGRTLELCLHLRCRYHGLVHPAQHSDWLDQLDHHDVDYCLLWDDGPADFRAPPGARYASPDEPRHPGVVVIEVGDLSSLR